MLQVLKEIHQLDNCAGDRVLFVNRHEAGWMFPCEYSLEDRRVVGEKSSVELKLNMVPVPLENQNSESCSGFGVS